MSVNGVAVISVANKYKTFLNLAGTNIQKGKNKAIYPGKEQRI